jgi:arsenate reductase (thioredoxin)
MFNVLVLCTHNSARSILGQVLLEHYGAGILHAHSAGSAPRANQTPNPLGLTVLREHGHAISELRSKSWDTFASPGATPIDLVITVCDSAAGEVCPLFLGAALKVHWSYADPSAGTGSEMQKLAAFRHTYDALQRRIQAFIVKAKEAQNATQLHAAAKAVESVA